MEHNLVPRRFCEVSIQRVVSDTDILFSVWSLTVPCGLHSLVLPLRGCDHLFASLAPLRENKKPASAALGYLQRSPARGGLYALPKTMFDIFSRAYKRRKIL